MTALVENRLMRAARDQASHLASSECETACIYESRVGVHTVTVQLASEPAPAGAALLEVIEP